MLTLFHDVTNPASVVAAARCDRLAGAGLEVSVITIDAIGIDLSLPVTSDLRADLAEHAAAAAAEGLELRAPAALPPSARCHAVGDLAEEAALGPQWRRATATALWEHGADLGDPDVLADLAAEIGLERARAAAQVGSRAAVTAVRRRSAAVRGQGIGGVPTLLAHRTLVPGLLSDEDLWSLTSASRRPRTGWDD